MALPDAIKIKVRRHLGYPVIGQYRISPAGGTLGTGTVGYRYFQAYGTMEYRMNNMLPAEEAVLTGQAVGAVGIVGGNPEPGDTFSITVSSQELTTPIEVTVIAGVGDTPVDIAKKLSFAVTTSQAMQQAGFSSIAPYGQGPYSYNDVPLPECAVMSAVEFAISLAFQSSGGCGLTLLSNGQLQSPFFEVGRGVVVNGYIPILDALEAAWAGSSRNMDTKVADVWQSRSNEAARRLSLYTMWQIRFGDFIGIPVCRESNAPSKMKQSGPMRYS